MLLLSLMVASGYFIATRYFWNLKARILKYMVQLLPESVVRLLTPATPPSAVWVWIFTFLGLMLLLSLVVASGYFIATHYFWTLKTRILKYLVQLLPESVVRLLVPTTPSSAVAAAADDA